MLQLVAKTARVKITVPEDVPAKIAATSGHPGLRAHCCLDQDRACIVISVAYFKIGLPVKYRSREAGFLEPVPAGSTILAMTAFRCPVRAPRQKKLPGHKANDLGF
jgi:hypothetical protein